ncbi:hypothetical protein MBT84_16530 [Streptomyces sp. MBT84]|nr:hypothetical protein [Streptomyces sp. MBT84]
MMSHCRNAGVVGPMAAESAPGTRKGRGSEAAALVNGLVARCHPCWYATREIPT